MSSKPLNSDKNDTGGGNQDCTKKGVGTPHSESWDLAVLHDVILPIYLYKVFILPIYLYKVWIHQPQASNSPSTDIVKSLWIIFMILNDINKNI